MSALITCLIWAGALWLGRWGRRHKARHDNTVSRNGTGPKWEQDAPMAECFEDEQEDDL